MLLYFFGDEFVVVRYVGVDYCVYVMVIFLMLVVLRWVCMWLVSRLMSCGVVFRYGKYLMCLKGLFILL